MFPCAVPWKWAPTLQAVQNFVSLKFFWKHFTQEIEQFSFFGQKFLKNSSSKEFWNSYFIESKATLEINLSG